MLGSDRPGIRPDRSFFLQMDLLAPENGAAGENRERSGS
jgi:hypothetical protein